MDENDAVYLLTTDCQNPSSNSDNSFTV